MDKYILMCAVLEEAYGKLNAAIALMYEPMQGKHTHPEAKEEIELFIKNLKNFY